MSNIKHSSEFIDYLMDNFHDGNGTGSDQVHLPSLNVLSQELNISVARLREQLEVAKALGLVEMRPRTWIRRLPYEFLPAVRQSLSYAIAIDRTNFKLYSSLRNHIEAAYWEESVTQLTHEDHQVLQNLMNDAWDKLRGDPIRIPHSEHRQLHLSIFARLQNPFVIGLLEAYWEMYEAFGLNLYADYRYLQQVWNYHQKMVDAICGGDLESGYEALVEHKDLLYHRYPTMVND